MQKIRPNSRRKIRFFISLCLFVSLFSMIFNPYITKSPKTFFLSHFPVNPQKSAPFSLPSNETLDLSEIQILILAENNVGANYFDVKNLLLSWGCNVTTISTREMVFSCGNTEPSQPITTDILISDLNDTQIQSYDCVFVPSGGYWGNVIYNFPVTTFIEKAYNLGLFISSMCVGTSILSKAGEIVKNTHVRCHVNGASLITAAGGIVTHGPTTITQNRIITAGNGGGYAMGGHTVAPYPELCCALIKNIFGYSFLGNITIEKLNSSSSTVDGATHRIAVKTSDLESLYSQFEEVSPSAITEVSLNVHYPKAIGGDEEVEEFILNLVDENYFELDVILPRNKNLLVEIFIENENRDMEIVSTEYSTTSNIPGWGFLGLGLFGFGSVMIITIGAWKRSGKSWRKEP